MSESADEDLLLAVLVQAFNSSTDPESAASITLTVGGLVVSGELVPAWVWLRELRGLLSDGNGSAAGGLADVFAMFADDALGDVLIQDATSGLEGALVDVDDDGDGLPPTPSLPTTLHLARAQILGAHHHQELPGGLWRGRLSQVSGWTLGRFEP